jgi:anti-sigma factor RsiW
VDCRAVVGLVTDYLDGALDRRTTRRVARHLRHCERCAEFVQQIRTTVSLLRLAFRGS